MSPLPSATQVHEAFQACRGWEQRARLLLNYGQLLPALTDAQRSPENLVQGCESPVWCVIADSPNLALQLDTDARLLKGLLAVLASRVQGLNHAELAAIDLNDWFNQLGLGRQLSPSRSNGLNAVLQHIQQHRHM